MALVYVSGYSEPMGHIKGDQLIDGTLQLSPLNVVLSIAQITDWTCNAQRVLPVV